MHLRTSVSWLLIQREVVESVNAPLVVIGDAPLGVTERRRTFMTLDVVIHVQWTSTFGAFRLSRMDGTSGCWPLPLSLPTEDNIDGEFGFGVTEIWKRSIVIVADRGVFALGIALGFLLYLELRPGIRCGSPTALSSGELNTLELAGAEILHGTEVLVRDARVSDKEAPLHDADEHGADKAEDVGEEREAHLHVHQPVLCLAASGR